MKFVLLFFPLLFSCTIFLPEVHVATERTAAEKQLIGNFSTTEELGGKSKSLQLFIEPFSLDSVVQDSLQDSIKHYANLRLLILADVISLKDSGYVGESLTGLLEFREVEYVNDRNAIVIDTENMVRNYIVNSYSMKYDVSKRESQRELYKFNVYSLLKNHYYQNKDGEWQTKN